MYWKEKKRGGRNNRPLNHISTVEKQSIRKSLIVELLCVNINRTWLMQLV